MPDEQGRRQWITEHVDRGHAITKQDDFIECSCGASYWPSADPVPSGAQPPVLNVEQMRANLHATFNGGHQDAATIRAFHHGMDTVCNVLAAHQRGESSSDILPPLSQTDRATPDYSTHTIVQFTIEPPLDRERWDALAKAAQDAGAVHAHVNPPRVLSQTDRAATPEQKKGGDDSGLCESTPRTHGASANAGVTHPATNTSASSPQAGRAEIEKALNAINELAAQMGVSLASGIHPHVGAIRDWTAQLAALIALDPPAEGQ